MSTAHTLILGAIAGVTILLGMPLGRLKHPAETLRVMLNGIAVGVLMFLFWDVLAHAWDPIDSALAGVKDGKGHLGTAVGYGALFLGGLFLGLMSLVWYERLLRKPTSPGTPADPSGGAVLPARRLALLIAVGIGLHNFGEGLAIGSSAAAGEISLATLLVIGFALHNATEGFGIVAPLAADRAAGEPRPSWRTLLGLAAIGGGPTFLGTVVGQSFTSPAVSTVFFTLAAGSILYVVVQLLGLAGRVGRREVLAWGLTLGLFAGFVTDAVVTAGGA